MEVDHMQLHMQLVHDNKQVMVVVYNIPDVRIGDLSNITNSAEARTMIYLLSRATVPSETIHTPELFQHFVTA